MSSSSWNFWSFCLIKHKYTYKVHAQKWAKLRLQGHYKAFRYLTQFLVWQREWAALVYSARHQCVCWPSYIVFRGIWLRVLPLSVLFIKKLSGPNSLWCKYETSDLCGSNAPGRSLRLSETFILGAKILNRCPSHICIDFLFTTALCSIAIIRALGTVGAENVQWDLNFNILHTCTAFLFWPTPISTSYSLPKWTDWYLLLFLYFNLVPQLLSGR